MNKITYAQFAKMIDASSLKLDTSYDDFRRIGELPAKNTVLAVPSSGRLIMLRCAKRSKER